MKDKLIIVGAGGHGKVCADIASKMGKWNTINFLDDEISNINFDDFHIIGNLSDVAKYIDSHDFFVAIGNNEVRYKILQDLVKKNANITTLIHPSSIMGLECTIGDGTVIMPGVVINCCTKIGDGCIINTSVSIDHDNKIGNFVHISPGAHLSGTVEVQDFTWVGAGVVIKNNLMITNNCIIGAGALVVKDIDEIGTYIGVPARKIV